MQMWLLPGADRVQPVLPPCQQLCEQAAYLAALGRCEDSG